MDHNLAADSMAVERYLLGEMNPDERTKFETHAFDCDECASAIRDGITLIDNGHALAEAERRFRWGRVVTWVPSAVAAALAVVVALQLFVPEPAPMPAIQVLTSYELDQARGAAQHVPANKLSVLYLNIAPEQPFPSYRCELRDASGKALLSQPLTAQQANQTIPLLLRPLPAGSYFVAIEGVREDGNRSKIATYEVNVQ